MIRNILNVEVYKQKRTILPVVIGGYLFTFILIASYGLLTKNSIMEFTKNFLAIDIFSGIIAPMLVTYAMIQTVTQDREAGNFLITNHVKNPYFDWGEIQIIFIWLINATISTIIIIFLSMLFIIPLGYLIVFNIFNLFMVTNVVYLMTRNFSGIISYLVGVAALLISLIAKTPLFDQTMIFIPPTWDIRMTYITMYNPHNFATCCVIFLGMSIIITILNLFISHFRNID